MTFKMKLRRGSVNVIRNTLAEPGWYDGKVDIAYTAGVILVDVLPEEDLKEKPRPLVKNGVVLPVDPGLLTSWLNFDFELEFTEAQRDTVKRCIEHNIKKSALPISSYTLDIFKAFGFEPES